MQVFWEHILYPLIKALKPKHIIEIGADTGLNTVRLAKYCSENNARLTSIDPAPSYDAAALQTLYPSNFESIFDTSISAIPQCAHSDLVLIDGDHNWYTVFHELKVIEQAMGAEMPLILLHDVGWPYSRRDMYYNHNTIPSEFLQDSRQAGLDYFSDSLTDEGPINPHLLQATASGTPRNGVLTAVEDFCAQSKIEYELVCIEGMFGLGLLFPKNRTDLAQLIRSQKINASMNLILERDRLSNWQRQLKQQREQEAATSRYQNSIDALEEQLSASKKHADALIEELASTKRLAHAMRISSRLKKISPPIPSTLRQPISAAVETWKTEGASVTAKKAVQKVRNKLRHATPVTSAYSTFANQEIQSVSFDRVLTATKKLSTPNLDATPMVSILIVTHNGLGHLKRLLPALMRTTSYPNYELIVVDNASTDGSLDFLQQQTLTPPIKTIANKKNESYSFANNQAANVAQGELLLLLNNDIEPLQNWLEHLVAAHQKSPHVGSVGAQLIYPDNPKEPLRNTIQHAGIAFEREDINGKTFLRPTHLYRGLPPVIKDSTPLTEHPCLTAACLLIDRETFWRVGGLDEGYEYGYEDVDLGLKLNKRGYRNLLCSQAVLVHHESSTQLKQKKRVLQERRQRNINRLRNAWQQYLEPLYLGEKLVAKTPFFSTTSLHVCFAVTEAGEDASAGDYFTALGLAEALAQKGFTYSFVCRNHGNWYDLPPATDLVIAMIDAYDIGKARHPLGKKFESIAWVRNWPDRWASNRSIGDFDLVLASSTIMIQELIHRANVKPHHFPIGFDGKRFNADAKSEPQFDYVFTGNNWGKRRDIQDCLSPSKLKYKFGVYGKGWENDEQFSAYHQGFVQFNQMPSVYHNAKIVIDDAVAGITKPYGSVNSRVFEATAAGALVLSNGEKGARELFGPALPTWNSTEELHALISKFLEDPDLLEATRKKMHGLVVSAHSYDARADELLRLLKKNLSIGESFSIKLPIPDKKQESLWGDYYLGLGLKSAFERAGHTAELHNISDWDSQSALNADVSLTLRGLTPHQPKKHQRNMMWLISHPDKVDTQELDGYETVFVASIPYAEHLKPQLNSTVHVLLQCTDPEFFRPQVNTNNAKNKEHDVLFVGNSRKVKRKAITDVLPCAYDLAIYGSHWEGLVDRKYVRATHIKNSELSSYYAGAKVLLNDHWEDMRAQGFISNRIFDALASGAYVATDHVSGIDQAFSPGLVHIFENREDLLKILDARLKQEPDPTLEAQRKSNCVEVCKQHNYDQRVADILSSIKKH